MTKDDPEARLARLSGMQQSISMATSKLQGHRLHRHMNVRIRPDFIFREQPIWGEFSDRRLPPKELRPPATRILTPNGAALRLYLLCIFEAQARNPTGMHPTDLPLRGNKSSIGWTDLLASGAEHQGRGISSASISDKKIRQLHNALKHLAAPAVQLVHLPNAHRRRGKYEQFKLLNESGVQQGIQNAPYTVPLPKEDTFDLPSGLFSHGWIHVLEDSEIAFLLMIAHRIHLWGHEVSIGASERIRHYGIGPDTYASHRMLGRFGLIQTERNPNRDEKGRVPHPNDPSYLIPHTFRLLRDGFSRPAVEVAIEHLGREPGSP